MQPQESSKNENGLPREITQDKVHGDNKLQHEALMAYYKTLFNNNEKLSNALVKLAQEKSKEKELFECFSKRRLSPLQIIQKYPEVVTAVAISKKAIESATNSDNIKDYQNNLSIARKQLEGVLKIPNLPQYVTQYLETLKETIDNIINDDETTLSANKRNAATEVERLFPDYLKEIYEIRSILSNFLAEFKTTALINEKSSKRYAMRTFWLSVIAIIVAVVGIFRSGTKDIVDAIYETHPKDMQQMSEKNNCTTMVLTGDENDKKIDSSLIGGSNNE